MQIQAKQRLTAAAPRADLIQHYEKQLAKIKQDWLGNHPEGSLEYERGMEYVKHAEANLEAVKNGRQW